MENLKVKELIEICEELGITLGRAKRKQAILAIMKDEGVSAEEVDEAWVDIKARPESALEAYNNGAAAVMVSTHGGRQLDEDLASIEALPEVVVAVGNRMEVYLDSGVRSGADAVKALSLGARAVFVGRPVHWGLAYNVRISTSCFQAFAQMAWAARQLLSFTERHGTVTGVPDAKSLCTDFIARESGYSQPLHRNCAPKNPWDDLLKYNIGN
ncbi:hypothetical protein HPB51_018359 [Rhipicephalus microplus]|uniref:FMN hydroxy acid dehydrogenase domain-containing protein n=1 Tax=Rhipicephalus microplus TaxID=6941 RepID=A0A9J6EUK8_RHIMP|nr:hypothetical protein HPB51_018359 [Rhipicephalus microplus]